MFSEQRTQRPAKKQLLAQGLPEFEHVQSRFCVTLCHESELFVPVVRGLAPGAEGPIREPGAVQSHADLFGPNAISFDPIEGRQIGFVPVLYFTPSDTSGRRYAGASDRTPGLSVQILQRLKELRELMILLAIIERSIPVDGYVLPGESVLRALDLDLPFEPDAMRQVWGLSDAARHKIHELFQTDRDEALGLVGFLEMMLGLFQETDSTIDECVLAFYQQREWRLVHHMRRGMIWYSLGSQPDFRSPYSRARRSEIRTIRHAIDSRSNRPREESYFSHCWVLEAIDGRPLREYIKSVIVPRAGVAEATGLLARSGCPAEVVAAEEYGYRP